MQKNKLTLLIDGNWLLMSRLAVLIQKYDNDYNELCNQLKLLMVKSIKLVLKQFPQIDNIIFCSDGGSWRNQIPIPEFVINEDGTPIIYKGTREKSHEIDWKLIFEAYSELITMLSNENIMIAKESGFEGDDLIWWWSTWLNKNNINCIIWTKDNDLKQLVNIDKNKCFTIWWNKDSGIFLNKYNEDEMDFLFNNEYNDNSKILSEITSMLPINIINKNHIIVDKIIRGDMGDNIDAIMYKQKPNSTRKYKISKTDINYDLNWKDDSEIYEYLKNLLSLKKYSKYVNKNLDTLFEHFKYNRMLVALDISQYPENLLEKANEFEYHVENPNKIINIENELIAKQNNLISILNIL